MTTQEREKVTVIVTNTTPCLFEYRQINAHGYGSGVGTAVGYCSVHGVEVAGMSTGKARCVVGKCEDAAAAVVGDLVKRIEALEAKR